MKNITEKKITDDLVITGIDISIAQLIATVKMRYLDYEFEAVYERNASGCKSIIMDNELGDRTHLSITAEVEENEEKILKWVNKQFELERDIPKSILRFAKIIDLGEHQVLVKKGFNSKSEVYTIIVETLIEMDGSEISPRLVLSYENFEQRNEAFEDFNQSNAEQAFEAFNNLMKN